MSKAGQKILNALQEFSAVLESGEPLENHFTVRTYAMPVEPAEYDGPAVRAVRERYSMSQGVFARFLCVSSATIQSWEQGRRVPSPIARRLLDEMAASPEHFRARFAQLTAPRETQALLSSTSERNKKPGRSAKKARVRVN